MRPLILAAAFALATPALAADFNAAPQVNVRAEGDGGAASASVDIAAPPAAVWAALTDCAGYPRYMPGVISCRIVSKGPGFEVREQKIKGLPLMKPLTNVFRADMTPPSRFSFHRVGGDWKRSEGEWRLTAVPGGTHVTYEIHVAMAGSAPAGLVRSSVASGLPRSLEALRKEALRRAR
jgi:carbon monoxide dehydrogenase subunit G